MKQVLLFLTAASLLASCNNAGDSSTSKTDSSSTKMDGGKMDYAYTIEHPDNWETGSKENTKMVLASLKAYETGDMEKSIQAFADSVEFKEDYMDMKVSRDTLKAMFEGHRKTIKGLEIRMHDFESVRSKDGKEEYVTLWYTQKMQDAAGKWDSTSNVNDLKIVNGKIAEIDEKIRHFPAKKM